MGMPYPYVRIAPWVEVSKVHAAPGSLEICEGVHVRATLVSALSKRRGNSDFHHDEVPDHIDWHVEIGLLKRKNPTSSQSYDIYRVQANTFSRLSSWFM